MLGLRYHVLEMQKLHSDLSTLVDDVFLMDERKESPLQRLCMHQSRDKSLAAKLAGLSKFMCVERRTYIDGHLFEPILSPAKEIEPPENITSRLFVGSDDLQAVLLTELEEIAQQNVRLKKCAYCGRYFHPFSSRTVYCDRLVGETEKSCKELAAKEKYERKSPPMRACPSISGEIKPMPCASAAHWGFIRIGVLSVEASRRVGCQAVYGRGAFFERTDADFGNTNCKDRAD